MGMHGTILSLPGSKNPRGGARLPGPARPGGRRPAAWRRPPRRPPTRRPARWRRVLPRATAAARVWRHSPWLAPTVILIAVACFCAIVEGPLWRQSTPLAAVNLAFGVVLVFTGLMLRREPGQTVPAVALMLTGIFRCVDFIDAWNGPWPAYAIVFGGVDRLFGAWALLRYPNSALSAVRRR